MVRVARAIGVCLGALAVAWADSDEEQCRQVSVCYPGGMQDIPCNPDEDRCPPCVTMTNNACYEFTGDGTVCPFDGTVCKDVFARRKGQTVEPTEAPTEAPTPEPSATVRPPTEKTDEPDVDRDNKTESNSTDEAKESESGANMDVVFAIIGGAIGLIAVAVIFLVLVRRSRAAEDDEDDLHDEFGVIPAYKQKGTARASMGTAAFGPALGKADPNPSATTNGVIDYYNQAPPSRPSPRSAVVARPVVHRSRPNSRADAYEAGLPNNGYLVATALESPTKTSTQPSSTDSHVAVAIDSSSNVRSRVASPRARRESYEF